jgi:uncharacterized membrane protein
MVLPLLVAGFVATAATRRRRGGGIGPRNRRRLMVLPLFAAGVVATAAGETVAASDTITMAGIVLTALGIVAMWAVDDDQRGAVASGGAAIFLTGAGLSAVAMTVNPSNPLLCAGMIATGIGTNGMWLGDKSDRWAYSVVAVSLGGIVALAVGLTVGASNVLAMLGMVLIGAGVAGMWMYGAEDEAEADLDSSLAMRWGPDFSRLDRTQTATAGSAETPPRGLEG